MGLADCLTFIRELVANNNRDWFAEHKDEYVECKAYFEQFTQQWIDRMSKVDSSLAGLQPKDCIWRIYRDTRFSLDKTPYKNHMGTFLASHGGKKSPYAGYYFHLQPDSCMFAAGMWCPEPDLLKKVRYSLLDNADEMEELMSQKSFRKYFSDFDTDYMLKKVPAGFPQNFEHADWLKRKTFTLSCSLTEKQVCADDFMEQLMEISLAAKPINDFLNFVFEED